MMWPHEKPEAHFTSHRLLLDKKDYELGIDYYYWFCLIMNATHNLHIGPFKKPFLLYFVIVVVNFVECQ
jgi:hypothetical protein